MHPSGHLLLKHVLVLGIRYRNSARAWEQNAARAKSERPPSVKSEGEDKSWAEQSDDIEAQAWPVQHHKGAPWDTWAPQKGAPPYGRPY